MAQQHLPAPPGPASPGKGRVWPPATPSPAQRESAPAAGLWFPGKAWWYGAACRGHARDAPSPDPFCPTSTKLGLAVGSGVTSKLVTCQFCIPFLHFHLPKFLLLLPHSTLWCGRGRAPGGVGDTCCRVPSSGGTLGIPQCYRACLWGWAFTPSGNERAVSNSVPSRAVTVLAIRVVILHVAARVMLVDPHYYRGTVARSWGFPWSERRLGMGSAPSWVHTRLISPQQFCFGQELEDLNSVL